MKLARVDRRGRTSWAIIDGESARLMSGDPYSDLGSPTEEVAISEISLLAPVQPSKIFCLGRNYDEHISEMGFVKPDRPSIFLKPPTTILGPGGDVELPPTWLSTDVEHEAELAIVIGRPMRFVAEEDVHEFILGFTCADDVSARDLQRADPHLTRGKGFDTFCPIGPWIETDVSLDEPRGVVGTVNGERRQVGSTTQMIHGIRSITSFLSQFSTLLPGDVILTGSPGGTGPLAPGDVVEIEIEGVGTLTHGVIASRRD